MNLYHSQANGQQNQENNEFSFPELLTPLSVSSFGQIHCPGPAEYCRVILLDHMERIVIHKTE